MEVFGVNKAIFYRPPDASTLLSSMSNGIQKEFAVMCNHAVSYVLPGGVPHLYVSKQSNNYKD